MTWDAPGTVLVIAAIGTQVGILIGLWRQSGKVNEIHTQTNSGLEKLREDNRVLKQKFDDFVLAQLTAATGAIQTANVRNLALEAEVIKRADAAVPPLREPNERKGD